MKLMKICLAASCLLAFAACRNNPDNTRNIQLLPDSSAYQNSSTTDSIRMKSENTADAKGTYRYHPAENSSHREVNESSTTEHRTVSQSPTASAGTQTTTTTTQTTRKKGWSKAAQGAVIGGAAGAVGGAIISKHKGTGAAIGAAVGAAGGYIIGRSKDKKDGRY